MFVVLVIAGLDIFKTLDSENNCNYYLVKRQREEYPSTF